MCKRSGGTNRVCFDCKIKYPGLLSFTELENNTQACGECGGKLTEIPDSIRVPRKIKKKAWAKLQADFNAGQLIKHYPPKYLARMDFFEQDKAQRRVDNKFSWRYVREKNRGFGLTVV